MIDCFSVDRIATRRLIDASAALDPAGRALLNLMLHRELSDEAIAAMAGLQPDQVSTRREDIVERLSRELAVPPAEVRAALGQISSVPAETAPEPAAPREPPATPEPQDTPEPPAPAPPRQVPPPAAPRQRPRLLPATLFAALIAVIVVVLILALDSHSTSPDRHHPSRPAVTAGTQTLGSAQALAPLSPTNSHASGRAEVIRAGSTRDLELTVTGLPPARGGHYEVWLYDSIIDSRPLGRLANGTTHLSLSLPPDAGAYRQIDIALQPPGSHYDSGESVLRGPNPAA